MLLALDLMRVEAVAYEMAPALVASVRPHGIAGIQELHAFRQAEVLTPDVGAVYGVLSLIVWALIVIVSLKYLVVMLRLDNRGEGGIMALLALILSIRRRPVFLALGLFGAALLYGDGIITPAISVLSATEGLAIATPAFAPWITKAPIAARSRVRLSTRFRHIPALVSDTGLWKPRRTRRR